MVISVRHHDRNLDTAPRDDLWSVGFGFVYYFAKLVFSVSQFPFFEFVIPPCIVVNRVEYLSYAGIQYGSQHINTQIVNKPPCRLFLVFAADAPIAVILRRGPTRHWKVIKWNTDTDSFQDGQWFFGNFYPERCGLSPDGSLFVYFAAKYRRQHPDGYANAFTAVSRPPYLTALAMWPSCSTWGGGGVFEDNLTLRLAYGRYHTCHPGNTDTELYMGSLPPVHPNHPSGPLQIETELHHYSPDIEFVGPPGDYPEADWTGVDHRGRKIFIRQGLLYSFVDRVEVLLRDFNPDVFEEVVSPEWARVW